ncbi:unnamed protein product, partial [Mesorhabditis spiculigera]
MTIEIAADGHVVEGSPLLAGIADDKLRGFLSTDPNSLLPSQRSQVPGEGGFLVADVTSPHGVGHRVIFNRHLNVFQFILLDGSRKHAITYRIDELLCVRDAAVKLKSGIPAFTGKEALSTNTLYFYFVYRKDKKKWRLKELPVRFSTPSERNYWQSIISATLRCIRQRPHKLTLFVNPFGGKGKARHIYKTQVEPFFLMAGIRCEVIETQRANHAHDYVLEMPQHEWESLEGLVSVGGDGLFNEILSAATQRTQAEAGKDMNSPSAPRLSTPSFRFGIIGAGSANSIVSTVHETDDWATAAVHIAIGSECNVDVCTVHENEKLLRISANAISYGWLGDVLEDSERFRWLGPIRYQWSALRTTVRHPMYRGRVQFSLVPKETQDPKEALPACVGECAICDGKETAGPYQYHWQADFTHVICCVIPTITPFTPHGLAPFTGIGDGSLDLSMVPKISRCHNMQFMRKVAMYGGKGLFGLDSSLNVYRVERWSYKPDMAVNASPGVWNLDGEILKQPADAALHFRLHPQLISFFGRDQAGIEPAKRSVIKRHRKSSIVYK